MGELQRFNGGDPIHLLDCPSCGGEAGAVHIGNNHSKRRLIRIRCKSCRLQREDAAIRNTWEWLEDKAAEQWNTLHHEPPKNEGGDDEAEAKEWLKLSAANMREQGFALMPGGEEFIIHAFLAGCQHARLNPSKTETCGAIADNPAVKAQKKENARRRETLRDIYESLSRTFNNKGIGSNDWSKLELLYTAAIEGVQAQIKGFVDGVSTRLIVPKPEPDRCPMCHVMFKGNRTSCGDHQKPCPDPWHDQKEDEGE